MSLWQVLVDELIWIILSHYAQPHPPQARDITHNQDLCWDHYINHITYGWKHYMMMAAHNEAGFLT